MPDNIIDARGQLCPKPLILTKKALKSGTGEFRVLLDNQTACDNVSRFLSDNGIQFNIDRTGGQMTLQVSGSIGELKQPDTGEYCPLPASASDSTEVAALRVNTNDPAGRNKPSVDGAASTGAETTTGTVFCFRTDKMGEGPEELGKILIQACCNTLVELDPLPSALVFYNSGIYLALGDSPVVESLRTLEDQGVRILVCGTCADFFDAKKDVGVGIVSNMYDILECLTGAARVIYP